MSLKAIDKTILREGCWTTFEEGKELNEHLYPEIMDMAFSSQLTTKRDHSPLQNFSTYPVSKLFMEDASLRA